MNIESRKTVTVVFYGTAALIVGILSCAYIVIMSRGIEDSVLGFLRLFMAISSGIILMGVLFDVGSTISKRYKFISFIIAYVAFVISIVLVTSCVIIEVNASEFIPVLVCNLALGGIVYIGDKLKRYSNETGEGGRIQKIERRITTIEERLAIVANIGKGVKQEAKIIEGTFDREGAAVKKETVKKAVAKKPAVKKAVAKPEAKVVTKKPEAKKPAVKKSK